MRQTAYMTQLLTRVLTEIVVPAVQRVLPEDPIDQLELAYCANPYVENETKQDAIRFEIQVAGEVWGHVIYAPEVFVSFEESRDRLISDLADFVAESRFGWGEKRD